MRPVLLLVPIALASLIFSQSRYTHQPTIGLTSFIPSARGCVLEPVTPICSKYFSRSQGSQTKTGRTVSRLVSTGFALELAERSQRSSHQTSTRGPQFKSSASD